MARRRLFDQFNTFINYWYGLFGITKDSKWLTQIPFAFFENLIIWIALGHYLGGKRKKISIWERLFLCIGVYADNIATGIGLENGEGEGNIIYEGTIVFFQNLFNISTVASTRWITVGETLILYFYTTYFGLNLATRITLHILNILRLYLGYERYQNMSGITYKYKISDYMTFVPASRKVTFGEFSYK